MAPVEVARLYAPGADGRVLTITHHATRGWGFTTRTHNASIDTVQPGLEEPVAEFSFAYLREGGLKSFDGGSGATVRFSGRSGSRTAFGGSSGASSSFNGSSGVSVRFSGSLGNSFSCDLSGMCDFFVELACAFGDASDCSEARSYRGECRSALASFSADPEIEAFICLFLRLFVCIFSAGIENAEQACNIEVDLDFFFDLDDDDDFGNGGPGGGGPPGGGPPGVETDEFTFDF